MERYFKGILELWESMESPEEVDKFFNMCVFSVVDGTLSLDESNQLLEKFQKRQPNPINYENYCRLLDLDPSRPEHKIMCHKYVWALGDVLGFGENTSLPPDP